MEYAGSGHGGFFKRLQRILKRLRDIIVPLGIAMISIGQWSDTKSVCVDVYEAIVTNFTDKIELKNLSKIKVGGNVKVVEKIFGIASLIKPSKTVANYEYRYYWNAKFILTVATQNHFIKGYQVISLDNSFNPNIPFRDNLLGTFSYAQYAESFDEYRTDDANLSYFLESHSLGRDGLFFNQFLTYVDFAAKYSEYDTNEINIHHLNRSILKNDRHQLQRSIVDIRASLIPNTFSIGNIGASTAADMLITKYEYFAYFKDEE